MSFTPKISLLIMMKRGSIVIGVAILVLGAILVAGCISTTLVPPTAAGLKRFNSTEEVEQYIRAATEQMHQETIPMMTRIGSMPMPVSAPAGWSGGAGEAAKDLSGTLSAGNSQGYSQTTIQVAGVDEPDIVKNDAGYIYVISGSTLAIVDAVPAANATVISKTELYDTPRDLFVNGNRLVLFTVGWGPEDSTTTTTDIVSGSYGVPPRYQTPIQTTHAIVYDISDRSTPQVLKDYTIEGDYIDARLIGSTVYMITREQIYPYYDGPIVIPALREGTTTVIQPDIWYFDNPEQQYSFTTVTSLNTDDGVVREAQTYLLGTGNIVYVSPEAMYVSYHQYRPVYYPRPPSPAGKVIPLVESAIGSGSSPAEAPSDFNSLDSEERSSIISSLRTAENEDIPGGEYDQVRTIIHKLAINDGKITYVARGEVPGTLENQFSMDEYNGNLRVATTSSVSTHAGQYTYNNVYVLNGQMDVIGNLTHIAEQETIYSTRFIGDRLYMVTFRRMDPFFVIDLSAPENPKVLGKLKVPGYSDYLHPYDATHIIGIGKETTTNEWGGVSTSGVKMALFDVSDVENPRQLDKVQIGDAGSDSPALTDHHAFLFDRERNLLVLPVRAISAGSPGDGEPYYYRQRVWDGAYVFGLTPDTGFTLRGTVQHGSGGDGYYAYDTYPSQVKRSLYIGDVLFTISPKQIKANSIGDINTTIATVPLPGFGDVYYPVVSK